MTTKRTTFQTLSSVVKSCVSSAHHVYLAVSNKSTTNKKAKGLLHGPRLKHGKRFCIAADKDQRRWLRPSDGRFNSVVKLTKGKLRNSLEGKNIKEKLQLIPRWGTLLRFYWQFLQYVPKAFSHLATVNRQISPHLRQFDGSKYSGMN